MEEEKEPSLKEKRIIKIIRNESNIKYHTLILNNGEELIIDSMIIHKLLGEKLHSNLIWDFEKVGPILLNNGRLTDLIIKRDEKDLENLKGWLKTHSYKKLPYYWKDIYHNLNVLGYDLKV